MGVEQAATARGASKINAVRLMIDSFPVVKYVAK
jgi:hypothetical protein